jgi:hypothetical protein
MLIKTRFESVGEASGTSLLAWKSEDIRTLFSYIYLTHLSQYLCIAPEYQRSLNSFIKFLIWPIPKTSGQRLPQLKREVNRLPQPVSQDSVKLLGLP